MAVDKKQKERIMKNLGLSAEEAEELLAYDKQVDRTSGGLEFDLSKEEQKAAIKQAHKGMVEKKSATPTIYKFDKRERKPNLPKQEIIAKLNDFITENIADNVTILNKERQLSFVLGENTFELTLIQKRKSKK